MTGNTTLAKKLLLSFGALFILFAGFVGSSLYTSETLGEQLEKSTDVIGQKLFLAGQLKADANNLHSSQRGTILYALQKDSEHASATQQDYAKTNHEMAANIAKIKPLLNTDQSRADIANLESSMEVYTSYFQQIVQLTAEGKGEEAFQLYRDKASPIGQAMEEAAGDVIQLEGRILANNGVEGAEKVRMARWVAFLLSIAALGAMLMTGLVVRGIVRKLQRISKELAESGLQLDAASGQIAASSQGLSSGSSEQASSLEEISASMEQMTAMTKRNAENSTQATAMMAETASQVSRSNSALQEMVSSMDAIKTSSEKVAKINKTIDEIAFQTNILALNAAVEAARAGEAGMGFAVVADEVRNLAQRSAVAAKDTAALIDEAIANSSQGAERLDQVALSIHAITESASKVKMLVDEVSEASKQQMQGINQVSTAVMQVSKVTQAAAGTAEKTAAGAKELSTRSECVLGLVNQLQTMVDGDSGHDTPFSPVARSNSGARTVSSSRNHVPSNASPEDLFPLGTPGGSGFRSF